jgi:hypothetical protein
VAERPKNPNWRGERACVICRTPFQAIPKRSTKTCSDKCGAVYRSENKKGRRNPNYVDGTGSSRRWSIRTKGEDRCRNCLRPATHLHHIVPRSKSPAGKQEIHANGLPLCIDCHMGWHHRTVTLHHDILSDDEFVFMVTEGGGLWGERNYPGRPSFPRKDTFAERVCRLVIFPDRCPDDCECREPVEISPSTFRQVSDRKAA